MALGAVLLLLASPLLAPQLLAFPHKTETDIGTIWSDEPLDPAMLAAATKEARARFEASPLSGDNETRWIFLTDGGWRWHYVAVGNGDAFAITRPFTPALIVNRTDPQTGTVQNGRAIGGQRGLAGVLAHEFAHGMIRERYGFLASRRFPDWKVEGYCDFVAGESSLTASEVARLEAEGTSHPALAYFNGRQRVAELLEQNGGSVDQLFNQN